MTDDDIRALGDGGLVCEDGWLGRDVALRVSAAAVPLGAMRPAGVSRDRRVHPDVRSDEIGWLPDTGGPPELQALVDRLEALRSTLNAAWLGLGRFELQLARYRPGARYARHRDAFARDPARRVTVVYYLNADWRDEDGGALRVHLADGVVDIAPLLDRMVVFRSEIVEHEVLPARRDRWAITAWYRGACEI
jgi:SM-20-related protein